MSKVINMLGGPSSGKSTIAAGVFYLLKRNHNKAGFVSEYATDLAYDERLHNLTETPEYIFAEQNRRIKRMVDKVDFVVTDSSILLSLIYQPSGYSQAFNQFVLDVFRKYNNVVYFIDRPRDVEFQQYGRIHNKEESEAKDQQILDMLHANDIPYTRLRANDDTHHLIFKSLK